MEDAGRLRLGVKGRKGGRWSNKWKFESLKEKREELELSKECKTIERGGGREMKKREQKVDIREALSRREERRRARTD